MIAYLELVRLRFGVHDEYELHISSNGEVSVLRLTPPQAERLIRDGVPVKG